MDKNFKPNHGRGDCDLCKKKKVPTMFAQVNDVKGAPVCHVCEDCFEKHDCTPLEEGKD